MIFNPPTHWLIHITCSLWAVSNRDQIDNQFSDMADTTERLVRISKIGGRYLVFDIDDVAYIRRQHGICAVFTGTMPQNPTQNVFLGLPTELYAEDAQILLDRKAAYIADDPSDHLMQLRTMDEATRKAYVQSLRSQRRTAQLVFQDQRAQTLAKHKDKRKPKNKTDTPTSEKTSSKAAGEEEEESLFESAPKPAPKPKQLAIKEPMPALTPTVSGPLVANKTSSLPLPKPSSYPLYSFLNKRGYFITPGLRFGGDFSVYPGDPFRYHAHYLANSFEWDEELPMLDLVTSGRLGTAVKKSYLFGGRPRSAAGEVGDGDDVEGDDGPRGEKGVRVFCIEWAGM